MSEVLLSYLNEVKLKVKLMNKSQVTILTMQCFLKFSKGEQHSLQSASLQIMSRFHYASGYLMEGGGLVCFYSISVKNTPVIIQGDNDNTTKEKKIVFM